MSYDGAGSIFALGIRLTKLDAAGAPLVGTNNCYVSEALVKADIGLEYEDDKAVTQLNGSGASCINFTAPPTLKQGTIGGLQICAPDPNLVSFMMGGDAISDTAAPTPNQIGYRAPQTGQPTVPNGVAVELWSRAVIGSAYAASLPYLWWMIPRAFLKAAGNWTLAGDSAMVPEFEGTSNENTAFGGGVGNAEWTWPSDRVWQYARVADIPDLSTGFVAVTAP